MKRALSLVFTLFFALNLSAGDINNGQQKSALCATCHGADGNNTNPIYPKLAGQGERYLIEQVNNFKGKDKKKIRDNALMAPMAAILSDADLADVAAFYAAQKVQHSAVKQEAIDIAQKLYRGGDGDRDIPACMACHGAKGEGIPSAGFPALSGQHPDYTKAQLIAFRDGSRVNQIMQDVVAKMSDPQLEALAAYLAGLH